MASSYPGGYDASFPGAPYTDNTEYVLAAFATGWVSAIQAIEQAVGYGSGSTAANPLYSVTFAESFSTITARLANTESYFGPLVAAGETGIPVIDTAVGDIQPVGTTAGVGNSGKAADGKHAHAYGFSGPTLTSKSVPGDVAAPGGSGLPERAGHVHGREAGTRTATVTSVGASLLTVQFGATSVPNVPYLYGYSPAVGDIVYVGEIGGGDTTAANLIVFGSALSSSPAGDAGFRVRQIGGTSTPVPNETFVTVKMNTVDEDTDGGYSVTTGFYTFQRPGRWITTGSVAFTENFNGYRNVDFAGTAPNNSGYTTGMSLNPGLLGFGGMNGAQIYRVLAGWTISLQVFQSSGSTISMSNAIGDTNLCGVWLGP